MATSFMLEAPIAATNLGPNYHILWQDPLVNFHYEDLDGEKGNQDGAFAHSVEDAQKLLAELLVCLTEARIYAPLVGKPIGFDTTEPLRQIQPIDSELGSTYAALLAFSAARGKNEHPATLIKALVYGLVRYHHTAYLQDKTAPAGDFTTPMHAILEAAENYNILIYDEDDEAAAPVECPQCERLFTDPADTNAIGDHALCTACLAAWRATAAMQNYAPNADSGDGFSDQPPFLPIPEWWAARGLATPDILADIAYDEAFREMEAK